MLCPYCNTDKPMHAVICHGCHSEVTITQHLIYSAILTFGPLYFWLIFLGMGWLYDFIADLFK